MKILYAMTGLFPYGSPYASRVLNLCRVMKNMGHDVVVFCDYISDSFSFDSSKSVFFEGIEIYPSFAKRNFLAKIFNTFKTKKNVKEYLIKNKVDVVVTSLNAPRFNFYRKLTQKNNVPLVLEICEKYHFSNWSFGRLDYRCWLFYFCWKFCYCKADGFVTISRLLENHFKKYNKPVIRIPTILDISSISSCVNRKEGDIINFVFSGALGHGKDSLVEFVLALYEVKNQLKHRFILNIYGPSKDAAKKQFGNVSYILEEMKDYVCFHGRIPQQNIANELIKNDFGIIIRPQRESSNAGFPTKFAEYMAVGLPVLANDTGDIGLYLNSSNGFLIENNDVDSLKKAFFVIDSLSCQSISNMRKISRETAERNFDFCLYRNKMSELLNCCVDTHKDL